MIIISGPVHRLRQGRSLNRQNRRQTPARRGQLPAPERVFVPSHLTTPVIATVASPPVNQEMSTERYEPQLKRTKTIANLTEMLNGPDSEDEDEELVEIPPDLISNEEYEQYVKNNQ